MPITVICVIVGILLIGIIAFIVTQVPDNPDLRQVLTSTFGMNKDFVDGLVTFGVYAFDVMLVVLFIHILSTYAKGFGKVSSHDVEFRSDEMSEIGEICDKFSKELNLDYTPRAYFYTYSKSKIEALGVEIKSSLHIRMNANMAKSIYEMDNYNKALEFFVAKELAHIYLGHTKASRVFLTFTGRIVPALGELYSRVCNYSADNVAAALVGEGASEALAMSEVKPKNTGFLNTKKLFRSQSKDLSKSEKFGVWYSNLFSHESPPSYRIEAIDNEKDGRLF